MFKPATTEYPVPYHLSRHFVGLPRICSIPPDINERTATVVSKSAILKACLLNGFQAIRPDLVGVLHGEYVVMPDGLMLLNRDGNWLYANTPLDNPLWARVPFDKINTDDARAVREATLEMWDRLPTAENTLIISSIWSNYYHYTFETIPKIRLAEQLNYGSVYMPVSITRHRYQQSLLERTLNTTSFITDGLVRARNPILAECVQSRDSLLWLRDKMKIASAPGRRRLLVRRTQAERRIGDNIAATDEFIALMDRYGFETVDFGSGEKSIDEQVAMLSGAEVLLAPHGAGLTNIAYLNPPLKVIEVFSAGVMSAAFMQISMHLGFRYYGVIEEHVRGDGDILVDVEQLDRILVECLGRRGKPPGRRRKPAAEPIAA